MRRWAARFAAVIGICLVVLLNPVGSAPSQAADCKPDGVPDGVGSGLPGQIDDPIAEPSGQTKYGDYGWSGLRWYTCDLGRGPDAVNDPIAMLDTYFGNMFMGTGTAEGAAMTQLHSWAVDPGELLDPVDDATAEITQIIRRAVWNEYVAAVVLVAAAWILVRALKGDVREGMHTFAAFVVAAGVVAWLAAGPVKAAHTFDDIAANIVGGVDESVADVSNQYSGKVSNDEARGATFNDAVLYPLWCRGALASEEVGKKYCEDLYEASSVSVDELDDFDTDDKRDDFNDVAGDIQDESDTAYDALKGKKHNRAGQGALAAVLMTVIAFIRIPAEILMVAGLLVVRLAVMFGPLFALFAILEGTRAIAFAGLKMLLASVVNVAIFGVIAAVHTGIVAGLVSADAGLIATLFIVTALTVIVWLISKPFRSPTKLATGQEAGDAIAGIGSAPGAMLGKLAGLLGTYAASRKGTADGIEDSRDKDDTGDPTHREEEDTRPPIIVDTPDTERVPNPDDTDRDDTERPLYPYPAYVPPDELDGGTGEQEHEAGDGRQQRGHEVRAGVTDGTDVEEDVYTPPRAELPPGSHRADRSTQLHVVADPVDVNHEHSVIEEGGEDDAATEPGGPTFAAGQPDEPTEVYLVHGGGGSGAESAPTSDSQMHLVEPEYDSNGEVTYEIFRPGPITEGDSEVPSNLGGEQK